MLRSQWLIVVLIPDSNFGVEGEIRVETESPYVRMVDMRVSSKFGESCFWM